MAKTRGIRIYADPMTRSADTRSGPDRDRNAQGGPGPQDEPGTPAPPASPEDGEPYPQDGDDSYVPL